MRAIKVASLLFLFILNGVATTLKCESEGCYEVIKTFAKLLDEKINETDKILAEAEKELNEVTFGHDEDFRNKLAEIDHRLTMLIIDLSTGIEGGEHTLFDLVNTVFREVNQAEENVSQLELSIETGSKILKIADIDYNNIDDVIRQVQEEFNRLQNETETDVPRALQDAFDKSEKFQSDTKELKEILDKMKVVLREYESNLHNAKDLTLLAIEKFTDVAKEADDTEIEQTEIDRMFELASRMKFPTHELASMKKLSQDALEEAYTVFDDSLELLDEVSLLELNSRLDDIKTHVEKLENYSTKTEQDVKTFAEDNVKFLAEMEETLEMAEEMRERAAEQMNELLRVMMNVKGIRDISERAVSDQEDTIREAMEIHDTLEDFKIKVEESKLNARRAMEKIPEIRQRIAESQAITKNLEKSVDENEKSAREAKEKCETAKANMDEVLRESAEISKRIEEVGDELSTMFENMRTANIDSERISDDIDRLKRFGGETEEITYRVREKVELTKTRGKQADEQVTKALEDIEGLVKIVENYKSVDEKTLSDFEKKLDEINGELEETELNRKIDALKEKRRKQEDQIENYRRELAFLEHQAKVIKENADALEDKCYKRTRLEP